MKLAHWQRGCTGQNYTVDEISDGNLNRGSRAATSLFLQQWHDTVGWVCDCACRCVYKRLCKKKHVRQIECFGDCMESWVESVGYGAFCLLSTLNIHF